MDFIDKMRINCWRMASFSIVSAGHEYENGQKFPAWRHITLTRKFIVTPTMLSNHQILFLNEALCPVTLISIWKQFWWEPVTNGSNSCTPNVWFSFGCYYGARIRDRTTEVLPCSRFQTHWVSGKLTLDTFFQIISSYLKQNDQSRRPLANCFYIDGWPLTRFPLPRSSHLP